MQIGSIGDWDSGHRHRPGRQYLDECGKVSRLLVHEVPNQLLLGEGGGWSRFMIRLAAAVSW